MISALLSLTLTTLGPGPDAQILEFWEKSLKKAFQMDERGAWIDINPDKWGPLIEVHLTSKRQVTLLGAMLGFQQIDGDGRTVFVRSTSTQMQRGTSNSELADELSSLPVSEVKSLINGVPFDSLSPQAQGLFGRIVMDCMPGLAGRLLAGDPSIKAQLAAVPMAQFQDGATGKKESIVLPCRSVPAEPVLLPVEATPQPPALDPSFAKPSEGTLTFEEGSVVKLGDVLPRAEVVFKTKFVVDDRLRRSYVFLKGNWTYEAFRKALIASGNVPLPIAIDPRDRELFGTLMKGQLKGLLDENPLTDDKLAKKEELANGKDVKANDALAAFPFLKEAFGAAQLGPGSSVTLRAGISFLIVGGGTAPLLGSRSTIGGKEVPVNGAARTGLVIPPP